MTVGIGALCDNGLTLILAADRKISMVFVEDEPESGKIRFLHQYWRSMISAEEDASYAFDVVRRARQRLKKHSNRPDTHTVRKIVGDAYRDVRNEHVAIKHLPPGWTLEDFNKHGSTSFSEAKHTEIVNEIMNYDLGIEILVCGFGEWRGEILHVGNKGLITTQTEFGFHAIGSGYHTALSSLILRKYAPSMPREEALYYVYEAKKAAESASGVGEKTDIIVFNWKRLPEPAWDQDLLALEKIRKRHAPRKFSKADKKSLNDLSVIKRSKQDD